jgi:hypothetical protein
MIQISCKAETLKASVEIEVTSFKVNIRSRLLPTSQTDESKVSSIEVSP